MTLQGTFTRCCSRPRPAAFSLTGNPHLTKDIYKRFADRAPNFQSNPRLRLP